MNENQSRTLDKWVGIPLCWMFSLLRRVGGWFSRSSPKSARPVEKILFIKLAEMGAIVLTVPAFEAARRRVGRENIFCLSMPGNRDAHDVIGIFPEENLLLIRDNNLFTLALDTWRFMRRCRRERIDAVIDLEGFTRVSAVLSFLSGARTRVGMHRYSAEGLYRGDLFTHRVALNYYNHASVQFLTMVEAVDDAADADVLVKRRTELADYRLPKLEPTDVESQTVGDLIDRRCGRTPSGPLVVFTPNLIDLLPLRRWPRENFVALGKRILANHPGATLLLTGLAEEQQLSDELAREISPERAVSLAGETTLRQLVVLLSQASLLVTSDCGTAHMAALTDIPIVSLFGPETPRQYSPLSPYNTSLWAQLACSPCLLPANYRTSDCRDNVCLQSITVDEVYEAALRACSALQASTHGESTVEIT